MGNGLDLHFFQHRDLMKKCKCLCDHISEDCPLKE